LETGDKLWDKGNFCINTKTNAFNTEAEILIIIFSHHASTGGIPSDFDEKTLKTGVVLKKSNDNCKSREPAGCRTHPVFTAPEGRNFCSESTKSNRKDACSDEA
jgi:hypothetical protein